MCIAAIIWQVFDDIPLVLLSNRDEFLERPTLAAHQWTDMPIFAGRDELSGGTWLGYFSPNTIENFPISSSPNNVRINIKKEEKLHTHHIEENEQHHLCAKKNLIDSTTASKKETVHNNRWAIVLNFRDTEPTHTKQVSRGKLVNQFLTSDLSPMRFAKQIQLTAYAGFNLIIGDEKQAVFVNNRGYSPTALHAGLHIFSNGQPNETWMKCERLRTRVYQEVLPLISQKVAPKEWQKVAFDALSDTCQAKDDALPSTGVPLKIEKALSSIFIEHGRIRSYATRTQSILTITASKSAHETQRTITLIHRDTESPMSS